MTPQEKLIRIRELEAELLKLRTAAPQEGHQEQQANPKAKPAVSEPFEKKTWQPWENCESKDAKQE